MSRLLSRRLLRHLTAATAPRPLPRTQSRPSSSFDQQPSPPRLPPAEQAEFERLQREAAMSSVFQEAQAQAQAQARQPPATSTPTSAAIETPGSDQEPSGGVWRGAPPEFDGEVNPKTGEVGGPKNEPLRWGAKGDWSYNGKVTDF